MTLTLQIQLLPDTDTAQKLKATVERFNEAANWLALKAYERKLANGIALHKLYYYELRARFSLSSQMACRCIAQVVEAYKRDKEVQPSFCHCYLSAPPRSCSLVITLTGGRLSDSP